MTGNQWNLGAENNVTMDQLLDWDKVNSVDFDGYAVTVEDHIVDFKQEL